MPLRQSWLTQSSRVVITLEGTTAVQQVSHDQLNDSQLVVFLPDAQLFLHGSTIE